MYMHTYIIIQVRTCTCTHYSIFDPIIYYTLCILLLQYIGRDGTVYNIQDDGDVVVRYTNNKLFQLNRHCLTQVSIEFRGPIISL